jgi:hypothetical protein
MKQKAPFKNMPKRQAKKFARLRGATEFQQTRRKMVRSKSAPK